MHEQPWFVEDLESRFRDVGFKLNFETKTGYPIDVYKNSFELVMAFILYRAHLKFKYDEAYPKYSRDNRHRRTDFSLYNPIHLQIPLSINAVDWPADKPVMHFEVKGNVHGKYWPRSAEQIEVLKKNGWRKKAGVGVNSNLLQREFLKSVGVETFPIGKDGLAYYYRRGLIFNRIESRLKQPT
ncbi:MAG: hypothetical protein M1361_01440 [Patescibacteria group bacterium]|nr:hypothetical protein [Patescibacteria group bacterium]MCL5224263.1 hypothetical protein [Patescibacteria group bacterium]